MSCVRRANWFHSYFASDITNRIFHEQERIVPWEYIGINVVIGSLASIADGLLMVYLLRKSPFKVAHAGHLGGLAMILAVVVYWIIGTASKGTQIWNLVVQNSNITDLESDGDQNANKIIRKSLQIFQDLDTVASGMLFLFAIGFAILASRYLNHKSKTKTLRNRLAFAVAILAAAFLVRNVVKFTFALIYSQLGKVAFLGVQLVYMAIYGLLSVIIFACIIACATIQGDEGASTTTRYGQVTETASSEPEDMSYHHQAKSMTQSYDPYRY
jgi:hypothetical protein